MGHIQATGFYMIHRIPIKYGLLYNWYAVDDERNIASSGWHVPTNTEINTLLTYVGSGSVNKLRESGLDYWSSTGGTNDYGFNARGNGVRSYSTGVFSVLKGWCYLWASNTSSGYPYGIYFLHTWTDATVTLFYHKEGHGIRLLKDSTDLGDGEIGSYKGNDGKIYRSICINDQEWLADNLAETKYRNGDTIPEITDNGDWVALTSGALCAYNNDWDNVL